MLIPSVVYSEINGIVAYNKYGLVLEATLKLNQAVDYTSRWYEK